MLKLGQKYYNIQTFFDKKHKKSEKDSKKSVKLRLKTG